MSQVTTASIITTIRGLIKDIKQKNGLDIFVYDIDDSFSFSQDYIDVLSIRVYVNDILIENDDWTYNQQLNKITLLCDLEKNDNVSLFYSYYNSYSDAEIIEFISANLGYFTTYRYIKSFILNEENNIVDDNGESPTVKEAQIIALITAIDIDPQNVKIQTDDFTLSSKETKGKQEQIQDTFVKFLKAYKS